MTETIIDFSRPPTDKERQQLERRLQRLENPALPAHLEALKTKLTDYERTGGKLRADGLRLRQSFVYLTDPVDTDSSDRTAPPRELRPPATRISSSRGSALRLQLTVIALIQLHRKPGAHAHLAELRIPIAGDSQHTGWSDLVAVLPTDNNVGGIYHTARDKRARTVRKALKCLEAAGLISVPGEPGDRNRFEGFVPLHEAGTKARGESEEYAIPKTSDAETFTMPTGFILNDWLHMLEDSEIAVLLMAACHEGAWPDDGLWAFRGEVRLRQYGIHRDPYSSARKTLEWFGLLDVNEIHRHPDGRAEDDDRRVNRIGINHTGFNAPALPTIRTAIHQQLDRR